MLGMTKKKNCQRDKMVSERTERPIHCRLCGCKCEKINK